MQERAVSVKPNSQVFSFLCQGGINSVKCTLHSELVREVLFTKRIYAFLHNPTNGFSLPLSPVKRSMEKF